MRKIISPELFKELQDCVDPLSKRSLTIIEDEKSVTVKIRFGDIAYQHIVTICELQTIYRIDVFMKNIVIDGRNKVLNEICNTFKIHIFRP